MTNENQIKYNKAFEKIFGSNQDSFQSMKFKESPEWNSMSQIALISTIEELFDIDFELNDIFAFNSYEKGKEILSLNYGIEF